MRTPISPGRTGRKRNGSYQTVNSKSCPSLCFPSNGGLSLGSGGAYGSVMEAPIQRGGAHLAHGTATRTDPFPSTRRHATARTSFSAR
jgi:hypothetical protein